MKFMSLALALLLQPALGWSTGINVSLGAVYPTIQCPAVGADYAKLVAQLDTIKAAIKATGNCKNVSTQVDNLQNLLDTDRQKVMDIINKADSSALSAADSLVVKNYAENITKLVSSLNDLFLNSNQCFEADAPSPLSALSGFVSEASTLAGSFTGPWGAPIALAGNIVAGFLSGLDDIFKSRAGYDFEKRDQWLAYVQNLCTYHSYRDQILHLIDPEGRIGQLRQLQSKLTLQVEKLNGVCPECKDIAAAYYAHPDLPAESITGLVIANVQSANARFSRPYGSYMLQDVGLLTWVGGEIKRMERESQSEWGNASGQYILTRAKDEIEDFLIRKEAPSFLNFQTSQAQEDYHSLVDFVGSEGRDVYSEISNLKSDAVSAPASDPFWGVADPMSYFSSLVLSPIHWEQLPAGESTDDLKFSWQHFRAESLLNLNRSQTTARVALSFCSFFKQTSQYSSDIRAACNSEEFKTLVDQQAKLDQAITKSEAGHPDLETEDLHASDIQKISSQESQNPARDPIDALIKTIDQRGL